MAQGEQRLVDVEEPVGELVAHHHARLQGEQPGVVLRAAPDVGLALGHVDLPSENGTNRTSQAAPARSPSRTCSWALRANGQR